jgi:hypothetical protein
MTAILAAICSASNSDPSADTGHLVRRNIGGRSSIKIARRAAAMCARR